MQLGTILIKDNVTLNYILKPTADIIFTLREIDDKVRPCTLILHRSSLHAMSSACTRAAFMQRRVSLSDTRLRCCGGLELVL